VGIVTVVVAAAFLIWTVLMRVGDPNFGIVLLLAVLAAVALVAGIVFNLAGREGWAFTFNALTIAFALLTIFMALFPNLMISTTDPAYSMSIAGAASSQKTLELMTWVAVFTLPLVLAYQAWTYWIFRKRLSREHIPADEPVAAVAS
jgi:cytochrome d ubiquinol oxidase subunit II